MTKAMTAAAMILLLALGAAWAAQEGAKNSATEATVDNPELVKLFNQAVDLLEQKKYEEAGSLLDKVVAMNPDSSIALKLRNQAKQQALLDAFLEAPPETVDTIKKFFALAERGRREWLRDQERIGKSVAKLVAAKEPTDIWTAIAELKTAGQHAVPQLFDALKKGKRDSHTTIDMALMACGPTVVLPLCEALNVQDDLVKQEIIFVLGQIKDTRALPALAAIAASDSPAPVKENALDSIKRIAGGNLQSAPVYYLEQARAYYRQRYDVLQNPHDDFIIWGWNAKDQSLVSRAVPEYAFYLEMTEKLCYQAIALDETFESVYPLLICSYLQQLNTYTSLLDAAEKGTLKNLTEAEIAGLKARKERVAGILSTATALGKQHFYGALNLALQEGNSTVAVACEDVLRSLGSPADLPVIVSGKGDRNMPGAGATADPLVAALDSDSKQVRYNAAVALAGMSTRAFPGSYKVVTVLCQALGERGARVVLVADADIQVTNQLKSDLNEAGYIADVASDPDAALVAGFSVPLKDALIVDAGFAKSTDRFLTDYRTSRMPIILLCTEENLDTAKAAYGGKVSGIVMKPVELPALQASLESAFKGMKDTSGKALALKMNYMAANAIASLNPAGTVLPLDTAVGVLAQSLELPDEVRLESMKALGNIGSQAAEPDLASVAANAGNSAAARQAALNALTAIAIKHGTVSFTVRELAEKLLADGEVGIREAAARLLGASASSATPIKQLIANPNWVDDVALNAAQPE